MSTNPQNKSLRACLCLFVAVQIMAAPVPDARNSPHPDKDLLLATLGTVLIRQSDFEHFLDGTGSADEKAALLADAAARGDALAAYLDLRVLAAKARKDGVDELTAFLKARELMEMKTLAGLFQERDRDQRLKQIMVTDDEIGRYYETHTNEFRIPPGFTARQILIYVKGNPAFPDQGLDDSTASVKAHEALRRLRNGDSWETVARQFSDDTATNERGGLMKDARFGYFAPEVEAAVRTQDLLKPGEPVRSQFGYHVLEVESRTAKNERQPLAQVKELIAGRLSSEKSATMREAYMKPIRVEVNLKTTAAAERDAFLLDSTTVRADEVLATLDGAPIRESDFQWFARDAYRPDQRVQAFARPGSRRSMVASYLDLRVLEAAARKRGMDQTERYRAIRSVEEMKLLGEFLQERDHTTPWTISGATEAAKAIALKNYLDQLRAELNFTVVPYP